MNWKTFVCIGALAGASSLAHAVSPAKLHAEMAKGRVTVIDVRSTELYQRGHIAGAINIPAAVCSAKKLPPLGRVVAYDGGIGDNLVESAITALNAKPGIEAEALEGGFAGWEAQKLPDTKGRGTDDQFLPMVTYQQLKTNATDDIVLVDLRKARSIQKDGILAGKSPPLTDLQSAFPQARVEKSAFNISAKKNAASGEATAPLLVLVDIGDGSAFETARALRANGITRFAILAGGEEIISRQGRAGSKRSGSTVTLPNLPTR